MPSQILAADFVLTMNDANHVIVDGAVLVDGGMIAAVDSRSDIELANPAAARLLRQERLQGRHLPAAVRDPALVKQAATMFPGRVAVGIENYSCNRLNRHLFKRSLPQPAWP